MMHIDNRHRVLPIHKFSSYEKFIFYSGDFGVEPIYIIIGSELYGYNILEGNKLFKLSENLLFYDKFVDIPESINNDVVCYVFAEEQIYHKWDGKVEKGYVFVAQTSESEYAIVVFSDYIDIDKIEVFDTCEQVCDTFFAFYDLDTFEGTLFTPERKHFFYCKENRNLYVVVDDENLNCVCSNVSYGDIKPQGVTISRSHKLFIDGHKCDTFKFEYNDMIWNIRFKK